MKLSKRNARKAGFSLVEMLVVIAVIGIIAAIAVPNIGRINDSAKDARMRRNAQNIASVVASAQAAGLNFVDFNNDGADDAMGTIIDSVVAGGTIPATDPSPFAGAFFGVPGLNAAQAKSTTDGAAKYLSVQNGMILYTGGQ